MIDAISWQTWGTAAFGAAQTESKPVLLVLWVPWSPACRRMRTVVLSDTTLVDVVEEHLIAVAVDAEQRPDIAERYGAGAWPTLAFLTPNGAVLTATTWMESKELVSTIEAVVRAFRDRRDELGRVVPVPGLPTVSAPAPADDDNPAVAGIDADAVLATCVGVAINQADWDYGGFGTAPKFPHAWPIHLLLTSVARTALTPPDPADSRAREDVRQFLTRTLDAMAFGPLWDDELGGFWRLARERDWTSPEPAKLLEVNVLLLDVLVHAWQVLDLERYRARATETAGFLVSSLQASDGGFFTSRWPESGRWTHDPALYADLNGRAIQSLLHATVALDLPDEVAYTAVRAVERVVPSLYERGAGMAHLWDDGPRVRGLLADQVAISGALLAALRMTGDVAYRDLADELMSSAWNKYWVPGWGWRDRLPTLAGAGRVGLLAEPLQPFAVSCQSARVLARLADATGQETHLERARGVLAMLAPGMAMQGLEAGAFALALLDVQRAG